jgi:DNA-binding MarR family transcriptional regulator
VKALHNIGDSQVRADLLERLFELGVRLTDSMDRGLANSGLTRARGELLWRLGREGPQTQRALSRLLDCTPRNVTGLVDALEASGHVARGPHPTDRRATVVRLTEKGKSEASAMDAEYAAAADGLLGGFDPAELTAFTTTLEAILSRLGAPSDATEPKAS